MRPAYSRELERCRREIARIDADPTSHQSKAYLVTMGREDWLKEMEFIRMKQETLIRMPRVRLRAAVRLRLAGFEFRQKAREARRQKKQAKKKAAEQETMF